MYNTSTFHRQVRRSSAIAIAHVAQVSPIAALKTAVGILLVLYVSLMAFTMTYAVIQTQYAEQARDASAHIGNLESNYFDALAKINQLDPVALGYTKPKVLSYALAPQSTAVATAQQ